MTRINVIDVRKLHNKHLVAEYHELPRVFKLAKSWHEKVGDPSTIPSDYKLGEGHVKFFYNKLLFCAIRHEQLFDEMRRRGYKPQHLASGFLKEMPKALKGDWVANQAAIELNTNRVEDRLKRMKL